MNRTAVAILLCQAAFAAAPVITDLQPRGAQRGSPFKLTVTGKNLGTGARISSTLPASFTLVNESQPAGEMATPGRSALFLVEPKADVAPGVYPIRVETAQGISNILLFTVGTFPEVTEEESLPYSKPNRNDSIETAQPLNSSPLTVNGTLRGAERDIFRVYGKAGGTPRIRVGGETLRFRDRSGAAHSGRQRQAACPQRRRAWRRSRRPHRLHFSSRGQLLRRGPRFAVQPASAELLSPEDGQLRLRRGHLSAGRQARRNRRRHVPRLPAPGHERKRSVDLTQDPA